MSRINRFTFRDLGFLMSVATCLAWLTILTTHWVSYIYIVEVFVQVHRCSHVYVSCVLLSFRRGCEPMVGHRPVDTANSF